MSPADALPSDVASYARSMTETHAPGLTTTPYVVRHTARPRRVLVVEDNLDTGRALTELVRDIGHDAQYAINGYAALELARALRPHFVLLDIGLPGMTGFEVCRRLKQDPELRLARVIAITAYGGEQHRAGARAAGCELHLVKPVSAQTLFDVLESSRA